MPGGTKLQTELNNLLHVVMLGSPGPWQKNIQNEY